MGGDCDEQCRSDPFLSERDTQVELGRLWRNGLICDAFTEANARPGFVADVDACPPVCYLSSPQRYTICSEGN